MLRNQCFLENCLFGVKNAFYPKTKVVPKTLSYCKTDKKIKYSKYIIICGVPKLAKKKAQNDLIHEPLKEFIFEKSFFSFVLQ